MTDKLHKLCYEHDINFNIQYGSGEDHFYIDAYQFGGGEWHVKKIRDMNDAIDYLYKDIVASIKGVDEK